VRHPAPGEHQATPAKRPHVLGPPRIDPRLILAAIVESSDDAIIGKTLQGVITSWNAGAERLYGYSAEQMIGQSVSVLVPLDRPDELEQILAKVRTGVRVEHMETQRVHQDGRLIDVSLTVSPIRDIDGRFVGASLIARDISDRRRADIAKSELAAIVASSDDAIIGKTLDGVITSWNQGAQRLYGYAAEEMVGHSIALLVPPERPHELEEILSHVGKSKAPKHFETNRVRKDGLLIYVSVTVSPIKDANGEVVGSSSVARDISQDVALRAALKASELRNADEVMRAKEEVVALVSHELRSPLASIVGFTELLYSRSLSDLQRKAYLGVMLKEGRRLTDLINRVLELQRLENGHQKLDLSPVDVKALLKRAVEGAGLDDRRALGLVVPDTLPLVMADAGAILQVLANFISNARKYSPDGGSIRIGARVVGKMVQVHVRDHGLGVPAADLPKLFQRFYRVDSPDRQSIRGTGLGLSINQKIIQAHGGRVEAHSEGLGKGSVFEFTLPVIHPEATGADVLIVENDVRFAKLLQAELEAHGLTAVRAGDAETAEHLLIDGMRPQAVVLDLVLPDMQGEEFLARLGARTGNRFPTIVLTVKDLQPAEVVLLQRAGAAAALPKEAGATQTAVALIVEALGPRLVKS
jgi:two-component system sensor histidine kinase VicK